MVKTTPDWTKSKPELRSESLHDRPHRQRNFDYQLDYYSEPPARAWKRRVIQTHF
jgi:hypothetical protein